MGIFKKMVVWTIFEKCNLFLEISLLDNAHLIVPIETSAIKIDDFI